MTHSEYEATVKLLHDAADDTVNKKRPDYTRSSADVLANFKNAAKTANITPLQAWLVHFEKQYSAIVNFIAHTESTPSEPIIQRFGDIRNYTDLGWALVVETAAERIGHGKEQVIGRKTKLRRKC